MGKANRIVDGKRNANIPVDMSDHFYDHGNEYCRYLITDPRSDRPVSYTHLTLPTTPYV